MVAILSFSDKVSPPSTEPSRNATWQWGGVSDAAGWAQTIPKTLDRGTCRTSPLTSIFDCSRSSESTSPVTLLSLPASSLMKIRSISTDGVAMAFSNSTFATFGSRRMARSKSTGNESGSPPPHSTRHNSFESATLFARSRPPPRRSTIAAGFSWLGAAAAGNSIRRRSSSVKSAGTPSPRSLPA